MNSLKKMPNGTEKGQREMSIYQLMKAHKRFGPFYEHCSASTPLKQRKGHPSSSAINHYNLQATSS
jgi:hypothetical protein